MRRFAEDVAAKHARSAVDSCQSEKKSLLVWSHHGDIGGKTKRNRGALPCQDSFEMITWPTQCARFRRLSESNGLLPSF